MSKIERLKAIQKELSKRRRILHPPTFIDDNFPKQKELILDPHRFQLWNCTRRGAKSTSFAKRACKKLNENPGHKGLYMALTLDSAKEILFDVVEKELDDNSIGYKADRNKGIFRLENGSQLRFFGVDSSYKEMKKALGQKLSIVGIDEAGSMTIDMETLCYQMTKPALSDLNGELILLGTCEHIPNTFFEAALTGKDSLSSLWKKHIWTTYENPYMAAIHHKEMEELKTANPNVVKASWFRTHYLNEWCTDEGLMIVRFNPLLNSVDEIPKEEYFYGLGVDLGWNDASSFTVVAFSKHDPNIYVIESFKSKELDLTEVSNTIKTLDEKYKLFAVEIDGANKQGIQEMQNRHGHRTKLESAEKTDKATFLRLFADDYKQGIVKHVGEGCKQLETEQSQLMWLKDTDKEDPRCENHCNDGALYIWRKCRNYLAQNKPKKVDKNSDEYMNSYAKRLLEQRKRQHDT